MSCDDYITDSPASSLELKARWTLFNSPLIQAKQIRDPIAGKLNDCVFCLSQDGTIAAFAVDGLHLYV